MDPLLKICGLMRAEDVSMCCRLGVDICGFVVEYPIEVPWNLTREECAKLLPYMSKPAKSCIVTGGSAAKVIDLAMALNPDLVQLHYNETLEDTKRIIQALSPLGIGVIKTIPMSGNERLRRFGTSDPGQCAELLNHTGAYAVLVDSRQPNNAAENGSSADLSLFAQVKASSELPVMLGGGITAENLSSITASVSPDIIDIMTGAETSPGVKDHAVVESLLKILNRY